MKKDDYLRDEFLDNVNGLPALIEHANYLLERAKMYGGPGEGEKKDYLEAWAFVRKIAHLKIKK